MLTARFCILLLALSGCTAILGDFSQSPPIDASERDDSGVFGDSSDASLDARPDGYPPPSSPDAGAGDAPPAGDAASPRVDGSALDAALTDASSKDAASPGDSAVIRDAATDAGWDAWSLVCTATFQGSITPTVAGCQEKMGVGISYSWYCNVTSTGTANTPCYDCGVGVACLIPSPDPSIPAAAGTTSLP